MMTYWRAGEIIIPAIKAINSREYVASAILARSLLELSSMYLYISNTISMSVDALEFHSNRLTTSDELEKFIIKAIWSTRLGEPEEHLIQKNILTIIQKIAKNSSASDLYPNYEYLCEIAHPNIIGNARFWSHIESVNPDGAEQRVISRSTLEKDPQQIIDRTIWSIAWGAAVCHNSHVIIETALRDLLGKIEMFRQ